MNDRRHVRSATSLRVTRFLVGDGSHARVLLVTWVAKESSFDYAELDWGSRHSG